MDSKTIKFHIPGFYDFFELNCILCNFMTSGYKNLFRENIKISSIYGSFPGAVWNGGRPIQGHCDEKSITNVIRYFESINIPVRFTFSNQCIDKSHLNDEYCNMILKIADTGKNDIIVNNPILESYLREHYPNFRYILSTTACIRDIDKINELSEVYDFVVLNYNDNKNDEFLNALVHKDKIEIMVNELCIPNCPNRVAHYEYQSLKQLGLTPKGYIYDCPSKAPTNPYSPMPEEYLKNQIVTPEELYGKYVDMGFTNFKLQGRGMPMMYTLENYLLYMVKPEYQNFIRYEMLKGC